MYVTDGNSNLSPALEDLNLITNQSGLYFGIIFTQNLFRLVLVILFKERHNWFGEGSRKGHKVKRVVGGMVAMGEYGFYNLTL